MGELFESDYRWLRERAAVLPLDDFALIELVGDDRVTWLQGQATNDVRNLATAGNGTSFCLCEPTGGLLAVIDAWSMPDRILMATARAQTRAVLDRVERMTILEDVEAHLLDLVRITVIGPQAASVLEEMPSTLLRRPIEEGWEIWAPAPSTSSLVGGHRVVLPEVAETVRLEFGIPKWGIDMGPKTLPPEMGAAFEVRYVSYNKGCYTGQEILMRIHSRGHTNRTWVGLVASSELKVGDPVTYEGKVVGAITSAAFSPDLGFLGAGSIRNEAVREGQTVVVGGAEAEVRQMPILRMA